MKIRAIIFRMLILAGAVASFSGCDLTESMQTEADKTLIFGKESGLNLYTNSFYQALPDIKTVSQQDKIIDIAAIQGLEKFMTSAYNADTDTGWSWGQLRNINYFIDGCHSPECTVEESARNHYLGIARFFRAYFYYSKLRQYGEAPWFEHQLNPYEKDLMYKDRDSRDVLIGNMIEDLDFAWAHIKTTSSTGNSLVSKYAAAALKSRICLFEASYRKYHADNEDIAALDEFTPADLYAQAADAAKKVIDSKVFSLNTSGSTPYRDLFSRESPLTNENILVICASGANGFLGTANWWYNSTSYGKKWSPTRTFVNTYLMTDGTPYTARASYKKDIFRDELKGRDKRLEQTVRGTGYKFDGVPTSAQLGGVCLTGYHMIKFSQDEKIYETGKNTNSIPVIRYAEVLLNYAEAKAELGNGVLSSEDWNMTIGLLRARAGVASTQPVTVDTYLQSTFYPDVTSVDLLEIRRERTIELVGEGFRFDDLRRWKCGELLENLPWSGIHFTKLDTPIDLNADGTDDVCIVAPGSSAPSSYKGLQVTLIKVFADLSQVSNSEFEGKDGNYSASHYAVGNDTDGYDLYWFPGELRTWYDDGRQYLYPVPAQEIRNYAAAGYTLSQNKGW